MSTQEHPTEGRRDLLIEVKDLRTYFQLAEGVVRAVDGVDFTVGKGETLDVQAIATNIDGKRLSSIPISMTFARMQWERKGGVWQEVEKDPQSCEVRSETEEVGCEFEPIMGGGYRILARVVDSEGRPNESELRLWVAGGPTKPSRDVDMEELTLIPYGCTNIRVTEFPRLKE